MSLFLLLYTSKTGGMFPISAFQLVFPCATGAHCFFPLLPSDHLFRVVYRWFCRKIYNGWSTQFLLSAVPETVCSHEQYSCLWVNYYFINLLFLLCLGLENNIWGFTDKGSSFHYITILNLPSQIFFVLFCKDQANKQIKV